MTKPAEDLHRENRMEMDILGAPSELVPATQLPAFRVRKTVAPWAINFLKKATCKRFPLLQRQPSLWWTAVRRKLPSSEWTVGSDAQVPIPTSSPGQQSWESHPEEGVDYIYFSFHLSASEAEAPWLPLRNWWGERVYFKQGKSFLLICLSLP